MNQQQKESQPKTPYQELIDTQRIIWLREDVRDDNAIEIVSQIMLLSQKDPEADIYLYINSPGGSVTAGMAIYDAMMLVPNDVVTVGMGMAASMGQFLLTAGAPGKRFATPRLRVLLHQPLGGTGGTQTSIQIEAQLINDMKTTLASITAQNTGRTVEEVISDGDNDHWYNAESSLEYGFVDHVINSFDEIKTLTSKDKK